MDSISETDCIFQRWLLKNLLFQMFLQCGSATFYYEVRSGSSPRPSVVAILRDSVECSINTGSSELRSHKKSCTSHLDSWFPLAMRKPRASMGAHVRGDQSPSAELPVANQHQLPTIWENPFGMPSPAELSDSHPSWDLIHATSGKIPREAGAEPKSNSRTSKR